MTRSCRPAPRLVPVLDLLGGVVVHAVAGDRARYRPIQSRLADGARPTEVAAALCRATGTRSLYVADLDGLQRAMPDWAAIRQLVDSGWELAVDAGVSDVARARQLIDAGVQQVIVPLERSAGPGEAAALLRACGADRLIFSLDLNGGAPLLPRGSNWDGRTASMLAETVLGLGFTTLLVLDLASVGCGTGVPTLPLCAELREKSPGCELWTGGGVRGWEDVDAAGDAGVDGVLAASAIHKGLLLPRSPAGRGGERQEA